MMREYIDFVYDIINEIHAIDRFIKGMDCTAFLADDKTSHAVVGSLKIICGHTNDQTISSIYHSQGGCV